MRCLYNNVAGTSSRGEADTDFIIAGLRPGLLVCTGFSGQGFKHAPVIGEFVAQLLDGRTAGLALG